MLRPSVCPRTGRARPGSSILASPQIEVVSEEVVSLGIAEVLESPPIVEIIPYNYPVVVEVAPLPASEKSLNLIRKDRKRLAKLNREE